MLVYVLYCLIDLRNEIVYVGAPLKLSYESDKNLVIKSKRNNNVLMILTKNRVEKLNRL